MKDQRWTREKPSEPGAYLFYGGVVPLRHSSRKHVRFHVCHAHQTRSGITLVAAGQFLYDGCFFGVFRPLDEEPPDLARFGIELGTGEKEHR